MLVNVGSRMGVDVFAHVWPQAELGVWRHQLKVRGEVDSALLSYPKYVQTQPIQSRFRFLLTFFLSPLSQLLVLPSSR